MPRAATSSPPPPAPPFSWPFVAAGAEASRRMTSITRSIASPGGSHAECASPSTGSSRSSAPSRSCWRSRPGSSTRTGSRRPQWSRRCTARGPRPGCEARFSDRVLANRFIYHFHDPHRGDVIVFETPPAAKAKCGAGGTFVKRIIGLPERAGADAAAARRGVRLHRREAPRRAVHRERPARHRPGGDVPRPRRATTSSWATTARSRATRACGARCRARTSSARSS